MKHFLRVVCVAVTAVSTLLFLPAHTALAQQPLGYQPGQTPFSFASTPGALPKTVVPERTRVHFELDPYVDAFSGSVTHVIRVTQPVSRVVLHADALTIGTVTLKGSEAPIALATDVTAQTITLTMPRELAIGTYEITLPFSGTMTGRGKGLYFAKYRLNDGSEKRMLATQMEPIGARDALPNFDEPSFRTVWEVSITADTKYTALSNMPVAKETITAGKRRTDFAPTPSMSSYLLALAVGEFEKTADRFENTDLAIYTVAGKHQNLTYAMDATKRVLAFYKDYFGTAYPLPKLDQIAVPDKSGAMENWGLVTYSQNLLIVDPASASYAQRFASFNVIAHEIAHQWFGNLVTMAWWDGLWLNESFASWMGHKATAALNPQWNTTTSLSEAKTEAMSLDALDNTAPIERPLLRDQNASDMFNAISYQKGHAVLNMIERFAGETAWRDGLRDYFARHAYSNATSADLWAAIARHTTTASDGGRGGVANDVLAFANAWTRQSGYPLLKVTARCIDGKQTVTLTQSRFALKHGYVPQQTWNLAVLVSFPGTVERAKQTVFVSTLQPKSINAGRCGEAVLVDVGGAGYYRVSYDETLQKALNWRVAKLGTADRVRMLSDAWALAEAGLAPPKRAFDLIASMRTGDDAELWTEAINVYGRVDQLLRNGPAFDASRAHARRSLSRAFAPLGWVPLAGETDTTRALRGALIATLGAYGDSAVLTESRQRVTAFFTAGGTQGDVLNGALRAVGVHADEKDLAQLAAAVVSGKYTALTRPLLDAISSVRNPAVAKQALALAISDTLPNQTARILVEDIAANGLHDQLTWRFTQDNLQALFALGSKRARRYVIAAPLQNSRDMQLAAAVKKLADSTLEDDAKGNVLREIASVERNAWAYEAVRDKLGFLGASSAQ
jgi:aminopeptidase N